MKNNILKDFTDIDLLNELLNRQNDKPPRLPLYYEFTPYEIMVKMIQQGWKENPKKGESDPRIDRIWDYLGYPEFTDDQSWCAATVNVCLKLAGYRTSDSIPVARSFESYGERTDDAKKGDIVVFKRTGSSWKGHVGFVREIKDRLITVAGGNQNNEVCFKTYDIKSLTLPFSATRRITKYCKISDPDFKTLKDWGLFQPLIQTHATNK